MMKSRSKRDSSESCRPMFSMGVLYWSYCGGNGATVSATAHRRMQHSGVSLTHPAVDRVGRRKHGAAGVKPGVDARLGDGDPALLHHLVDGRAVHVGHLVELVDADHAAVGQHHGTCLQTSLA